MCAALQRYLFMKMTYYPSTPGEFLHGLVCLEAAMAASSSLARNDCCPLRTWPLGTEDYEPPGFRGLDQEKLGYFGRKACAMEVGAVATQYHGVTLRVPLRPSLALLCLPYSASAIWPLQGLYIFAIRCLDQEVTRGPYHLAESVR